MKRKINPNPELILAGKWKKNETAGEASVALTEKVFNAPFDDSPPSLATRIHEYEHLEFSVPREKLGLSSAEQRNRMLQDCISGLEDHRVNWLGTNKCGLDIRAAGHIEDIEKFIRQISYQPVPYVASLYVSSRLYTMDERIQLKMNEKLKEFLPELDSIVSDLSDHAESVPFMVESARRMVEIFMKDARKKAGEEPDKGEPGKGEGKPSDGTGKTSKPDKPPKTEKAKAAERKALADYTPPAEEATVLDVVKQEKLTAEARIVQPGEMTIKDKHKMKNAGLYRGIRIKPKRKPSQFGSTFRCAHRILTDKACFSIPRRDSLGTVLVDQSSSMHLSEEDVLEILKSGSAGATIAGYSGRYKDGDLNIMARNGRVVSEIPDQSGGLNVVDLPALEWLVKQPAPRYWICDGMVTGIDDDQGEELSATCRALKKKGRIKQFYSVKEFMTLMRSGRLRYYKDKNTIY